ncbi:MAG: cupin domain-containing protein [Clostridia bacterium]|nr:cupin domain-containing protein [Clostridia bacterium]
MTIDFKNATYSELPNFNGGEGVFRADIFNDGLNKILKGRLDHGCTIGLHCHDTSSEIIFILEGEGEVLHEGETTPLSAGDCHYCKKGESHSLRNFGDRPLIFYAVVAQQ